MDHPTENAARWGIETGYFDVQGRRHEASAETLRRMVEILAGQGTAPQPFSGHGLQPVPAYQGDGRRSWLLAVQLYGVRSRRNWGHGDFSDLAAVLEIVAKAGGAGVGLNPLHALFYDRPGAGSPYSPSSRLFLNPLYIDVEAIEEFQPAHVMGLSEDIARLRAAVLVDYHAVAKLKLVALRVVYQSFLAAAGGERRRDLDIYRRERGHELQCFAAFETLRRQHPGAWPDWPEPWRTPDDDVLRRLRSSHPDEFGFHEFLQWNAERQLQRCRERARSLGMPIGLYLDTAVGVSTAGADAWMEQGAVLRGLTVGAPPDQYNPAGQNWHLTAYNPHALLARDFAPFRQMLRAAMRHAGAMRIDHVLGLMRLFVIPHGLGAAEGVYLRYPFAAMLSVVAEESRRWRCIAIGEDLGTVPEGFRATAAVWGVWSSLVMLFERNADGSFRRPDDYPEMAIATFGTHDLATIEGWISGHDLRGKRAIGVDPGESDDERGRSRAALQAAVAGDRQPGCDDVVAFLAATPTRLVSIAIEDVLGDVEQVNVPGTIEQHPNWRRRWSVSIEELAGDQRLGRIAEILSRAGRATARPS